MRTCNLKFQPSIFRRDFTCLNLKPITIAQYHYFCILRQNTSVELNLKKVREYFLNIILSSSVKLCQVRVLVSPLKCEADSYSRSFHIVFGLSPVAGEGTVDMCQIRLLSRGDILGK